MKIVDALSFTEATQGLVAGDFSRLAPCFERNGANEPVIMEWHKAGLFKNEPKALAEAFTCACFNGLSEVVAYFLNAGLDPSGGMNTGMNALHWAANRGHLDVVRLLIAAKAPLEIRNRYGGTILDCAVWSAMNEPRGQQMKIIQELVLAGADVTAVERPTGNGKIDAILDGNTHPRQ